MVIKGWYNEEFSSIDRFAVEYAYVIDCRYAVMYTFVSTLVNTDLKAKRPKGYFIMKKYAPSLGRKHLVFITLQNR